MTEQVLKTGVSEKSKFTAKVFGFMFIGLLITALVALLTSFLLVKLAPEDIAAHKFPAPFAIVVIFASIAYLVCMIITQIKASQNKMTGALIPGIIATISMGILVSVVTIFLEWWIIASAFAITATTFAVMFLIGYFAKRDLSILALIGWGLLSGALIIGCLTGIFAIFLRGNAALWTIASTSLLIDGALLIYVLLISVFDMQRIRKLSEAGYTSNGIALAMATSLYVDFIYIFLRVLALIARSRN